MHRHEAALRRLKRNFLSNREKKECINILQELVDKATPKKPVVELDDDYNEFGEQLIYAEYCPNCSEDLTEEGGAFCHGCGQRIDWRLK